MEQLVRRQDALQLIAIAVIIAMVFLRGQIENIFSNIGNNLT